MSSSSVRLAQLHAADLAIRAGRGADAEGMFQTLVAADPQDGVALLAWGRLRHVMGDVPAASQLLQRAIAADAGPPALVALAALLIDHANLAAAENLLHQALAKDPLLAAAHFQLGRAHAARGYGETAVDLFRAASRADPNSVVVQFELAKTLASLGRLEEAAAAYQALVKRSPANVTAVLGQGWVLGQMHRFHEAMECFDRAEALGADIAQPLAEVALGLAHVCDWAKRDHLRQRLRERLEKPEPCLFDPYVVLSGEDDPALHQKMAMRLAGTVRHHMQAVARPAHATPGGGRIRLGYLSADFNQHATALLMSEVFLRHDRQRFEVIAFSYSHNDGSDMRRRVTGAFDRFEELELEPPEMSARRIAAAGIDILIDLKGYTTGARPEIAALRPAPIQVSHLGYPATMGADWFDYVIADPIVLPMNEQAFWQERIVHLPHSYQPNDRTRKLPLAGAGDRAVHGLPPGAFVFACFNNSYKITPGQFALWMEILTAVPNAVLWLYRSNSFAERALRKEAARFGVAPERLHFAPAMELGPHLARHGCADLFLDTSPYGAHTTAADALWAGLPLITWPGSCFASRVGASLLHAVGLPELVAQSRADYKALAIRLAQDPTALRGLRGRLELARATAPLFDAAKYTENLERAFETMMERHRLGLPPEAFAVADERSLHR